MLSDIPRSVVLGVCGRAKASGKVGETDPRHTYESESLLQDRIGAGDGCSYTRVS